MKILKYFFLSFIKTVFGVLSLIVIVYLIITYIENSVYYFSHRTVPTKIKFFYYLWQIPDIALQFLPFAVLIGGIISHWLISRTGEISALRSAGMSLWRTSLPFILGAFFYVAIHFFSAEFVRPYSFKKFYHIKYNVIDHRPEKEIFVKTNWIKSKKGILHFDEYNDVTKSLKNVEFFEFSPNDQSKLKVIVESDFAAFDEHKKLWILTNPYVTEIENKQIHGVSQISVFETDIAFSPPRLLKENINSDELSYAELSKLIESAKRAHIAVSDRVVDLYLKFSLPFSSLLFILFTVPFALQKERQEASYFSVLICLVLTSAYWFGNLGLKNLAAHGFIPPVIAAWGLNILFGLFAIIIIYKLDKPA